MAAGLLNLVVMEVTALACIALLALLVVLSSYRRRCGHPALRLLVWAASSLSLPLVSYAASAAARMDAARLPLLLAWTVLLNTLRTTVDTARSSSAGAGGRGAKLRPSVEQLARTGWVAFLIVSSGGAAGSPELAGLLLWLWVLGLAKLVHRLVAAELAERSVAVDLVSGYMAQLHGPQEEVDQELEVPPYLVMGEEGLPMEPRPGGYRVARAPPCGDTGRVVTVARIRRLAASGDPLMASQPRLADVCLSFALFKLQLRRLAGSGRLAEAGSRRALAFVLRGLLGDGGDAGRAFRVVEAELSFLADFAYSKLAVFYASGWWFPAVNLLLVAATWISCIAVGGAIGHDMADRGSALAVDYQVLRDYLHSHGLNDVVFQVIVGLDVLVTIAFIAAVVFTEAWEIASYLCSDWIKVSIVCEYARRPSWRKSPWARAKLGRVLRLQAMEQWDDRFGQYSILDHHPRCCGCLSRQVDRMARPSAPVPPAVKAAVAAALRASGGRLGDGSLSLRRNGVSERLLWACHGAGDGETSVAEMILVWHVATALVAIKQSEGGGGGGEEEKEEGGDAVVALRLSRYCAYLVAAKPELLPEHRAWTESVHEGVAGEAARVLAGFVGPVVRYERAVACLGACMSAALREAARLGRQLAEEAAAAAGEEFVWKVLAEFWAEVVLYVAPSENAAAHVKALRRGGEFITVLWALLGHAGIVSQPAAGV